MAVVTFYLSDRDPEQRMFKSKKEADEYDKKLELAESLSTFIGQQIESVSDDMAETLGMLIADHKDRIMLAFKGKPQALFEVTDSTENSTTSEIKEDEKKLVNKKTGEKVVSLN